MSYSTFSSEETNSPSESHLTKKPLTEVEGNKYATSETNTFMNLYKANIGLGILAMPLAFSYSGLWLGLFATPLLAFICIYCMYVLVESSRELRQRLGCGPMNMKHTIEAAFNNGPVSVRKFSKAAAIVTNIAIFVNQIGFCTIYYEFVSENINQGLHAITNISLTPLHLNLYLLLPFFCVASVRYLKIISYLSSIATVFQIVSVMIIMYYCTRDIQDLNTVTAVGEPKNFVLFFGNILFAFEGIGSLLLIEGEMKDAKPFLGLNGILVTVMASVVLFYTTVGFYGYLQYGDAVKGSITLSMPNDEIAAQSVKIFMAVSIFLTFPIQFHVAVDSARSLFVAEGRSDRNILIREYVFRISCVFFCFALAATVPNLGLMTSLVGAFSGSIIGIISPTLCNLMTFWPDEGVPKKKLLHAVFLLTVGIIVFIFGTVSAISGIAESFKASGNSVSQ